MGLKAALFLFLASAITLGAASPADAGETCGTLKQFASVEMILDGVGRPLVPVTVDGQQKMMMLDTGGTISTLTQKAFEESGRTPLRRNDILLYDVFGNKMDRSVTLPSLTIGQVRGGSWRFWIHPPDVDLGTTASGPIAGLLAPDILNQFDVDLDFPNRTAKLFSPDHCEGGIFYWKATSGAVIPFQFVSGHIVVPVTIDGERLEAIIDTGAGGTVMNSTVARRRFGLDESTTNSGPSLHQFKSLAFAGLIVENPTVRLRADQIAKAMPSEMGGVTSEARQGLPDVIIGQNIMGQFHVYIAYRERKLYVTD
jgi:predicted aspartyl protease